ncbi:hypothetical protein ACPPVT_07605 [Angustibacter sp. McL0619]|uniref:hypothetical protein n=1 Tax=Angustibacter sp. McL0619 TaxID=3415676 RepID=UPI003CE74042
MSGPTNSGERQKPIRSVAQAICPSCNRRTTKGDVKLTGLVLQGQHLIWRPHDVVTWGGAHTPCPASGTTVCTNPAKAASYIEAVRCRHQRPHVT